MIMVDGEGCTTNGHGGCDDVTYYDAWNDDVSSFRLTEGCTHTLWEHINEGGAHFRTDNSYSAIGDWDDVASEALCVC